MVIYSLDNGLSFGIYGFSETASYAGAKMPIWHWHNYLAQCFVYKSFGICLQYVCNKCMPSNLKSNLALSNKVIHLKLKDIIITPKNEINT